MNQRNFIGNSNQTESETLNQSLELNFCNLNTIIKFRALNEDHGFLFLKINNCIKIFDLILLKNLASLHIDDRIVDFEVSPKKSVIIVATIKSLYKFELNQTSENSHKDFHIKLQFRVTKEAPALSIHSISISTLGDMIATIDRVGRINLYNFDFEQIKSVDTKFSSERILKYNIFQITYDTRNILLASCSIDKSLFNQEDEILFLYRNIQYNPKDTSQNEEFHKEMLMISCGSILNGEGLASIKEVQKSMRCYIASSQVSIYLILTRSNSFLVARKIFKQKEQPSMVIAHFINLNLNSTFNNFRSDMTLSLVRVPSDDGITVNRNQITFSLLYNNENPIFSDRQGSVTDILPSNLINPDYWYSIQTNRFNEYDEDSTQITSASLAKASLDYIAFNINGKIQIYCAEGLNKSSFEELSMTPFKSFTSEPTLMLLRFMKNNDNKHSMFFLDEHNMVRKFEVSTNFTEEEISLKIFTNIRSVSFNRKNRKLAILEYINNNSIIVVTNHKLYLTKVFVIENVLLKNLEWVDHDSRNTHLNWGFASLLSFTAEKTICFLNFRSPIFNHKINLLSLEDLRSLHLFMDTSFNKIVYPHSSQSLDSDTIDIQMQNYYTEVITDKYKGSNKRENTLYINIYKFYGKKMICGSYSINFINKEDSCDAKKEEHQFENTNVNDDLDDLYVSTEFVFKRIKSSTLIYDLETNQMSFSNFAFQQGRIFYFEINQKLNVVEIKEIVGQIKPDGESSSYFRKENQKVRSVFDFLVQGTVLHASFFENDTLVVITELFIESYTLSTSFYNRIKNSFFESSESKLDIGGVNSVSSKLIGNFIFLNMITSKGIKFERLPKNKNPFEAFEIRFNNPIKITELTKYITSCGLLVVNRYQIEFISEISEIETSEELNYSMQFNSFENRFQNLLLLNINPNSLYELETALDYFLDNREELVCNLLSMFYNLQNKLIEENFDLSLISTKGLPNFFALDDSQIRKILFDNTANTSSIQGVKPQRTTTMIGYSEEDFGFKVDDVDFTKKMSMDEEESASVEVHKKNRLIHRSSILEDRPKFELFVQNPDLSLSDQCSLFYRIDRNIAATSQKNTKKKSSNLRHISLLYETLLSEYTKKLDHITKYFIVKIRSKSLALDYSSFRLNTSDLCWLNMINDQEYILKFLLNDKKAINFKVLQRFCIPLWIKNEFKLKELLETTGKNEYNTLLVSDMGAGDTLVRNLAEKVALYFYLSGKSNLILEKYDKESHNSKSAKFLRSNFKEAKIQKQARDNAFHLLGAKRYLIAIYMFLLGDDVKSALETCVDKLNDINLAVCIVKLYPSVCAYYNKEKFELEKKELYEKLFFKFGSLIRDPWLVVYSHITDGRYDLIIEYIQGYRQYSIRDQYGMSKGTNNITLEEDLEFIQHEYETINSVMDIQIFDYKLFFFVKEIEKLYKTELSKQTSSQQSQHNTNFDDIWGGSDDEDSKPAVSSNADAAQGKLKTVEINFKGLLELCVEDAIFKGVLISPILSHYKQLTGNSFPESFRLERNLSSQPGRLKKVNPASLFIELLCKRVVLDTINVQTMDKNRYLEDYLKTFDRVIFFLTKNNVLKAEDAYSRMNISFLKLEKYSFSIYSSFKSNNVLLSLEILGKEFENQLIYILDEAFKYNLESNIEVSALLNFVKYKLYPIAYFIQEVLCLNGSLSATKPFECKVDNTHDSEIKRAQNVMIIRIVLKCYFMLIGAAKSIHKFNKVKELSQSLRLLCSDFQNLIDNPENISGFLENIILVSQSLCKAPRTTSHQFESTHYVYLMILNRCIIEKVKTTIELNFEGLNRFHKDTSIQHIHDFKFIKRIMIVMSNYITTFDINFVQVISRHLDIKEKAMCINELKEVYKNKNDSPSLNYTKFNVIEIKRIFKNSEKFSSFEAEFRLENFVFKYLSFIPPKISYEKKSFVQSYSAASIETVKEIYLNNGIEVVKLSEESKISGYDTNACNPAQFAISLSNSDTHKRVNILNSILKANRSEGLYKLVEPDQFVEDKDYFDVQNHDQLMDSKIKSCFSYILPIIRDIYYKKKPSNYKSNLFFNTITLPPDVYNGDHYSNYLVESPQIGPPQAGKTILKDGSHHTCTSHPLLPIYALSNERGCISFWSYLSQNLSTKPLYEFYLDKSYKEGNNMKTKLLKTVKFNSYGNQFIAIDEDNGIYSFDYELHRFLPKTSLNYSVNKPVKDACFVGASENIVCTHNENSNKSTHFWDFLLPSHIANIADVSGVGGNIINCLSTEPSIFVANDSIGHITLIDKRKYQSVYTFEAHSNEEIRSMVFSDSGQIMATASTGGVVKIWDIANRCEPVLVETINPFVKQINMKKISLLLKNDCLFAAGSSSIKLLRNKLE